MGSTSPALAGGVALLERAMGYTLGALTLVTPGTLSRPTPCQGWDLRALLRHMNESLQTMHEAAAEGHLSLSSAAAFGDPAGDYGDPVSDPVGCLRSRACQMIGAWTNVPGLRDIEVADRVITSSLVAVTGAVEVAVHGWDVTQACGTSRPLPAALAEELIEVAVLLCGDQDRGGQFAAPVPVSATATASDRLVALLGRRPG